MFTIRRFRTAALAIATAIAVPAVGFVATSANAAGPDVNATYKGKTIAQVNVRKFPTTASKKIDSFKKGTTFEIQCKVNGPNVDGNRRWYLFKRVNKPGYGWVAARYVKNVGKAPQECKMGFPDGKVVAKPSVKLRTAPSTKAKVAGSLKYGTEFHTICKVNGPSVDGNKRWYQLYDGRWVPARWVKNINHLVPEFCS
jgi:uncharacterized protein YgiM (DUF1202 family)